MAESRISFGEWLPDHPGISGTLQEARNVVPQVNGYGPLPGVAEYSLAATENLNSVFSGKYSTSTTVFAGGNTKLFKFDGTDRSLDNVSKTGGYTGSNPWNWTQFGNVVIAGNGAEKLQAWTLGSSTAFADLAAAAPTARFVNVVRDFVVAARTTSNPNRVYWSDINDETNWTSGPASQSDYQDIPDGGDIQGITGGEYGLILCEQSIVRMSYIGAPLFFQFDTISSTLGCYEPGSIAQYGPLTFFLSDDGFYMCNGQTVTPIGVEKVDRWFWEDVSPALVTQISSAIDPLKKIVLWCYPNTNAGMSLLMYNWQIQRWSYGTTTADYVASMATAGVTLEGLDTYSTSIDALDVSLDSRQWAGGRLLFGGAQDDKIVSFTGDNLSGLIETGDIGGGQQSVVKLARPQVDNGSATVAVASRDLLEDQLSFGAASSPDSDNRVSLRSSGRYHRLRVVPTGSDWMTAAAVDVDIVPRGRR
jgi:hypothetical protein